MLYLFTGNPGEGKTLNALDFVIKKREDDLKEYGVHRKVYVVNFQRFSDGKIFDESHSLYDKVSDWIELEAPDITENLWSLYDDNHPKIEWGSIVLIDECQDFYPTRSRGEVPEFLKFFEKHRHTGCDFVAVTQKIRQVDVHFRALVNEHRHFSRIMGQNAVRIKKLNRVMEGKDEDSAEIETSQKRFPKKLFGLYRSAATHTHNKKLPKKLYAIPFLVFLIVLLVSFAVWSLTGFLSSDDPTPGISSPVLEKKKPEFAQSVDEKISLFHPSLVSHKYRIAYFDLSDRVRITDEKAFYHISKKENCRFHQVFGFVCVFDDQFLILRSSNDEDSDSPGPF
ncbi:zonular occludens toxin domain-containing protein [Thiomicrorhabdus chilensis]|uniref:zonular occludens toxin domain-containing protein n=1 Tax=Thiomicrorhabdus chilensis TaxID=63656 RepID=UPI00040F11BA|nr:zonular occludens toxin domain-containing protein [Thiomicrorhabdus chilensis]